MIQNPHTPGDLAEFLIGDLGVARRHCARILDGGLVPTEAVLREMHRSIERCVERIEAAVRPLDPKPEGGDDAAG